MIAKGVVKILILFLSISILCSAKGEEAHDKCCSTIRVETTGLSNSTQKARMGLYERIDTFFERPVYLHQDEPEYLFYMGGRSRGLWMIGPEVGTFSGGLANRADKICVDEIDSVWKFADGTSWIKDPLLKVQCEKDFTECFYSDNSYLVGNGNDLVTIETATTGQCIDRCVQTWGCRYWTVQKIDTSSGDSSNVCTLKKWKGQLVHKEGYISGSLPSACYDPSTSLATDSNGTKDGQTKERHCAYKDLEFVGSDLKTLTLTNFDDCKTSCSQYKDCSFFTITKSKCNLKGKNVEIRKRSGVVSGATDEICREIQAQQKSREEAALNGQYDENEINGKFRIISESWKQELENPDSKEYVDISTTLKDGLIQALANENQLTEQAEFNVDIVSLRKGSVVCNFKIRYVLKEAFAAVPFRINPSNVTGALDKTFQFRRGVLFQRFVIASGSFLASSPVDHCDAKGCSHKCSFDYDLEDYMCTCPKTLSLDPVDNKTCIGSLTGEKGSEATTLSPVTISLLPTDCLWSEWSDWTACPAGCGSGFRTRSRKVAIPERNGGSCKGESEEKYECTATDCNVPTASTEKTSISDQDIPRAFSLEDGATTQYLKEATTQTPTDEEISEKAVQTKIGEGKVGLVSESTTELAGKEEVKTEKEGRRDEMTTLAPEKADEKAVTEEFDQKKPEESTIKITSGDKTQTSEESTTKVPEKEKVTLFAEVESRTDKAGEKSEEATTQAASEFEAKTEKGETTLKISPEVEGKSEESTSRHPDLDKIIPLTEPEARREEEELTTKLPIGAFSESKTDLETVTEEAKHGEDNIEATTSKALIEETETATEHIARIDKEETTTTTSRFSPEVEGKFAESTTRRPDLEIIIPITEQEAEEGEEEITTQLPFGTLTESKTELETLTEAGKHGDEVTSKSVEGNIEATTQKTESVTEHTARIDQEETTTRTSKISPEVEGKSVESITRLPDLEIIIPVTEQEAKEGEKEITTQLPEGTVVTRIQQEPELGAKTEKEETTLRILPEIEDKAVESTTRQLELEINIPVTEQEAREEEKEITTQVSEGTVFTRIQQEPALEAKTDKVETNTGILPEVEGKTEESTTGQTYLEIIIPVTEQEAREVEVEVTTLVSDKSQKEAEIQTKSDKEIVAETTTLKVEILSEIHTEAKNVTEESNTPEVKESVSEITTQIPVQTTRVEFKAYADETTLTSVTQGAIELTTLEPGTIIEIIPEQEPEARKEPSESTSVKEKQEENTVKPSLGGFLLPVTESEQRQEETTIKAESKLGATEAAEEITTQIPTKEESITEQEGRKVTDELAEERTQATTQAPEGGINLPVTEQAARKEEDEFNTTFKTDEAEEKQARETTTTTVTKLIMTEIESSSKGEVENESRTEQTSFEKPEVTTIKGEPSEEEKEAGAEIKDGLTTQIPVSASELSITVQSVQEKSKEEEEEERTTIRVKGIESVSSDTERPSTEASVTVPKIITQIKDELQTTTLTPGEELESRTEKEIEISTVSSGQGQTTSNILVVGISDSDISETTTVKTSTIKESEGSTEYKGLEEEAITFPSIESREETTLSSTEGKEETTLSSTEGKEETTLSSTEVKASAVEGSSTTLPTTETTRVFIVTPTSVLKEGVAVTPAEDITAQPKVEGETLEEDNETTTESITQSSTQTLTKNIEEEQIGIKETTILPYSPEGELTEEFGENFTGIVIHLGDEKQTTILPESRTVTEDKESTTTLPSAKEGVSGVFETTEQLQETEGQTTEQPRSSFVGPTTTTTSKPSLSSVSQKEIESRLLNTTEENETTLAPLEQENTTILGLKASEDKTKAEETTVISSPKIIIDIGAESTEKQEETTLSGILLVKEKEISIQTTQSSIEKSEETTVASNESSTFIALAITLSAKSTTEAQTESTSSSIPEEITTMVSEKDFVQSTTQTTRAEPKQISVADILVGTTTTSSGVSEETGLPATTESIHKQGAAEEEFMYPMSPSDEQTTQEPILSKSITTNASISESVTEREQSTETLESQTEIIAGVEETTASILTEEAGEAASTTIINDIIFEILEGVEATTAFDTIVKISTSRKEDQTTESGIKIEVEGRIGQAEESVTFLPSVKEKELVLSEETTQTEETVTEIATKALTPEATEEQQTVSSKIATEQESSTNKGPEVQDSEDSTTEVEGQAEESFTTLPSIEKKEPVLIEQTTEIPDAISETTTKTLTQEAREEQQTDSSKAVTTQESSTDKGIKTEELESSTATLEVTKELQEEQTTQSIIDTVVQFITTTLSGREVQLETTTPSVAPKESTVPSQESRTEAEVIASKFEEAETTEGSGTAVEIIPYQTTIKSDETEETTLESVQEKTAQEPGSVLEVSAESTTLIVETLREKEVEVETATSTEFKEETTLSPSPEARKETIEGLTESPTTALIPSEKKEIVVAEQELTTVSQKETDLEATTQPSLKTAEEEVKSTLEDTVEVTTMKEPLVKEAEVESTTLMTGIEKEATSLNVTEELTTTLPALFKQGEKVEETEATTTIPIEGREGLDTTLSTVSEEKEVLKAIGNDTSTGSFLEIIYADTTEEGTTVKPDGRTDVSTVKELTEEFHVEVTTISSLLDLTTIKLVLEKGPEGELIVHATTEAGTEPEVTTFGYRIKEAGEPDKEIATTILSATTEKEFMVVDEEPEAGTVKNQTLHTLKCLPTTNVPAEPGTIPMECIDQATSIEPIIVMISAEGLDLQSISRNKIKIVVKEFMLMEMQQLQAPKK